VIEGLPYRRIFLARPAAARDTMQRQHDDRLRCWRPQHQTVHHAKIEIIEAARGRVQ
jgi:hypothetical protein